MFGGRDGRLLDQKPIRPQELEEILDDYVMRRALAANPVEAGAQRK